MERMPYSYDGRSYDNGGYSNHFSKENIRMDLMDMMNNSTNDKERTAIYQFLEQWRSINN